MKTVFVLSIMMTKAACFGVKGRSEVHVFSTAEACVERELILRLEYKQNYDRIYSVCSKKIIE